MYVALLAHGTELNAASVALMIPGFALRPLPRPCGCSKRKAPCAKPTTWSCSFCIVMRLSNLGRGNAGPADAMSLDASWHLWNAWVDPRRRTYAMGIYAHVLDQWGIIYDQPLVLHQRQAGAAIEGMVRQNVAGPAERLAVDTHGYTDFAWPSANSWAAISVRG